MHFCTTGFLYAQFSGGNGTLEDPYLVGTVEDLQNVADYPDQYFLQINDIDASKTREWDEGAGFTPIGTEEEPFSGFYDGNDRTISGLSVNISKDTPAGLFGFTRYAEIRDLSLKDISVKGNDMTGGLAGQVINTLIINISVSGTISGATYSGGIAGYNQGAIEFSESTATINGSSYVGGIAGINRGSIHRAKSSGNISGTDFGIGGIVGNNYDGSISESFSSSDLTGEKGLSMGGITGSNGGTIIRSYSEGEITGRTYLGGLVGNNTTGSIKHSYSTTSVSGFNLIGGIAGVNRNGGIIHEVYSTGDVAGNISTGALIGVNEDSLSKTYWSQEAHDSPVGKGNSEGTNLISLKSENDENFKDFSFDEIWGKSDEELPILLWTVPYFTVTETEFKPIVSKGEYWEIQVLLKNAGGLPYSGNISLVNEEDDILDQSQELSLKSGQEAKLYLAWQTTPDHHGDYRYYLRTDHSQKPIEVTVLNMPQNVILQSPFDLQEQVSTSPSFRWRHAKLADSYIFQISENENFESILHQSENIDTTYYELDLELDHRAYYFWRVHGVNDDYEGPWSEPSAFITLIEKPDPVTLISPDNENGKTFNESTFIWSSSSRAENYTLELSFDDEFEEILFDTSMVAGDTLFTYEKELPSETEIFWRIQASNIGGNSEWSEPYSFRTVPRAKQQFGTNTTVSYSLDQNYPNPFNPVTYIRYSLPEANRVRIDVLNMLGQIVATPVNGYRSAGRHTFSFDASDLSSGTYIYRIQASNFSDSKKFSLVK